MSGNNRIMISIDDIAIDTTQARRGKWEDDEKDKRLIDSIKGIGLIYDVIVRPTDSEKYGGKTDKPYAIVAGSRRFYSMIQAGFTKIPCKVIDMTDTEAIAMSFSENMGRKDLTEYQKMITILTWIELLLTEKYSEGTDKERRTKAIKEIANIAFGGTTNQVYQILNVEKLPKELQILIKKPEERTESEKLILKKFKITPEFKMNFNTLSVIEKITSQLGEIPSKEKVEKIFEIIKNFSLEGETWLKQYEILGSIRDKLKEQKTFEIVMKEVREEKDIPAPSINWIQSVGFKLPREYGLWHANACKRASMKTAEIVRNVYLEWLEKEAKREGW